jgi:hypothetical protein
MMIRTFVQRHITFIIFLPGKPKPWLQSLKLDGDLDRQVGVDQLSYKASTAMGPGPNVG